MTLFEQISNDIKEAMKAREKDKLESLRAIKAQLLLAKTAEGAQDEVTDDDGIKILQRMVKQRKESAEIYKSQGRTDLYEKEMLEVSYIEPYLPKQMSEEELVAALKAIIAQTGATSGKDMGKVMGMASKQFAGKADNKTISAKLKELLGS